MNNQVIKGQDLEKLRAKAERINLISIFITITISAIITTVFILLNSESLIMINLLLVFAALIICAWYSNKTAKKFHKKYKEFVLEILKTKFSNINYSKNGLSRNIISKTNSINMKYTFTSNDKIKAKYKDLDFVFSDIIMEDKSGKHRELYFKGQWFIFDFKKKFKSKLYICKQKNNDFQKQFIYSINPSLKKIEFENEIFNDEFNVYAENEFDAFYILTPIFMKKVINIFKNIGDCILYFENSKLHIGVHNYRDFYEHDIKQPFDLAKSKEEILLECNYIINIIDMLDLNNGLFEE